ncbi:acireductone dioxygenase [Pseudomonas sp. LRF_L74]|uniref:acireductone dioxygenase n=1 Tax=Pseudomonas sp. LRF_L74 TaxID=3369422 RepID=UPI003F6116D9
MSSLTVYHQSSPQLPNKLLNDWTDIASTLAAVGVGFERLQVNGPIRPGADEHEVVAACRVQLDALMSQQGYEVFDVLSLDRNHPQSSALRARLVEEHRHPEDELRLFVAGRGLVNLHIGDCVYAILCERNDLLTIPAGTRHWLDIGESAHIVLIRLFRTPAGRQAEFTGDPVAQGFVRLDD